MLRGVSWVHLGVHHVADSLQPALPRPEGGARGLAAQALLADALHSGTQAAVYVGH